MDARENELITCPYNVSHQILRNRMQTHLAKCRKNYTDQNMVTCPFNTTHEVPSVELNYHKQVCSDRVGLDKFIYVEHTTTSQDLYPIEHINIESTENWDDAPAVFYDANKYCEENAIVRPLNCAPAAQRRNFRMEERKRIQTLTNTKPNEEKVVQAQRIPLNLPRTKPNIDEHDVSEETLTMKQDISKVRQILTNAREQQRQSLLKKTMNDMSINTASSKPAVTSSLPLYNNDDFPPPGGSRPGIGRGRGRNVALDSLKHN